MKAAHLCLERAPSFPHIFLGFFMWPMRTLRSRKVGLLLKAMQLRV